MRIEEPLLRPHANNLTLVRLVLASSVIYTHCYWALTGRMGEDDLSAFLGAPISAYAVDGFFFLSGFLVFASLQRSARVGDFLLARVARLWPALAVSVGLTVLAGYCFTNDPPGYFDGATLEFITNNLSFKTAGYHLTGVMCDGSPCTINGSLWTLPWEARFYLVLGALAMLGLTNDRAMIWFVLPVTVVGAIMWDISAGRSAIIALLGTDWAHSANMTDRLWPLFALGAAAYIFRSRIRLSWAMLGLLFIINVVAHQWGVGLHVRAIFIGYALLCFGLLTVGKRAVAGSWPDYSYGMYIYAFPVMIGLRHWLDWESHFMLAAATALATFPLAAFSWHYVEKPVLDAFQLYRKRRRERLSPVRSAA